jgi:hypothetical protein
VFVERAAATSWGDADVRAGRAGLAVDREALRRGNS